MIDDSRRRAVPVSEHRLPGIAIASIILAVSCVGSWIGAILGVISIAKIRNDPQLRGMGLAICAVVIGGILSLFLMIGLMVFVLFALPSTLIRIYTPESKKQEIRVRTNLDMFVFGQDMYIEFGDVDQDSDGIKEFGFLQELAETAPHRTVGAQRQAYRSSVPTFMSKTYGAVSPDGIATAEGYYYKVFLPSAAGTPIGETNPLPKGNAADADLQERAFIFYAWSASAQSPSQKCFVVNQRNHVYFMENIDEAGNLIYVGLEKVPDATAALLKGHEDSNKLTAPFPDAAKGEVGNDGHTWETKPHYSGIPQRNIQKRVGD